MTEGAPNPTSNHRCKRCGGELEADSPSTTEHVTFEACLRIQWIEIRKLREFIEKKCCGTGPRNDAERWRLIDSWRAETMASPDETPASHSALDMTERLLRIHAICRYLRDLKPCELCPPTFTDPIHGECVRMCFSLAEEVSNIAVHGNPWGERASEAGIKKFRETFNAE